MGPKHCKSPATRSVYDSLGQEHEVANACTDWYCDPGYEPHGDDCVQIKEQDRATRASTVGPNARKEAARAEGTIPASSTSESPEAKRRGRVLSCYVAEYRRHHQGEPTIDDKDREAADKLLARYRGKTSLVCDKIQAALVGRLYEMPLTLASVAAYDEHAKQRVRQDVDVSPTTRSRLNQRVHDQEMRQMSPGAMP